MLLDLYLQGDCLMEEEREYERERWEIGRGEVGGGKGMEGRGRENNLYHITYPIEYISQPLAHLFAPLLQPIAPQSTVLKYLHPIPLLENLQNNKNKQTKQTKCYSFGSPTPAWDNAST